MVIFVLAGPFEELIPAPLIDYRMRDWRAAIRKDNAVALSPVKRTAEADDAIERIHREVALPIQAARQRLLNDVPA